MAYVISVQCKHCKQKVLITVDETMFSKNLPVRCKSCDKIFSVAVPREDVFLKKKPPPPGGTIIESIKKKETILKLEVKQNQFSEHQVFTINQKVTTVGRKDSNSNADIQIETTDLCISRVHLVIEKKKDDGFTIADKNSKNGTYVNDDKLKKEDTFYIKDGDIIGLGKTKIEVRI